VEYSEQLPKGWGDDFQQMLLHNAIFGTLLKDVPGLFSAEWFGEIEGLQARAPRVRLAKLVEDFYREYSMAPGPVVMEELLSGSARSLSPTEYKVLREEWDSIAGVSDPKARWVTDRVRRWTRHRAYSRAVYGMAEILDQADKNEALEFDVQCDTLVEKARLVGLSEQGAVPLLATAQERVAQWQRGDSRENKIPTGLRELDEALGGGVERGEAFYFLAPPKGGKSTFLMNVAWAGARRRHNVLLCSFEMAGKAMARRSDRRIALATKEQLHAEPERLSKAVSAYRAAGSGEVYLWSGVAAKNGVLDAEAQMLSLQKQGVRIDLVIMDYLVFMVPARGREDEMRHRLAAVSQEISNFARKWNVAVWCAALVNRAAVSKKIITKKDIAEAFQVVAIADGVVAICAPKILLDNGLRSLYLAAIRESEDERVVGLYRFDGARMRVAATDEPWPEDDEDEEQQPEQSRAATPPDGRSEAAKKFFGVS
jgi:archaellum biogenesis ATPase FlaH